MWIISVLQTARTFRESPWRSKWPRRTAVECGGAVRVVKHAAKNVLATALLSAVAAGCSLKQTAVDIIGDALSDSGGVYASDNDPDLIREAVPFGLKTYESLLEVSPRHRGLLLAAASGFAAYAYLLQDQAEQIDAHDLTRARKLRARASKLYLRGRDHALRGLELRYEDFSPSLYLDLTATIAGTTQEDVPFLYWAGAGWAGAIGAAKGDMNLIAALPIAAALVERVLVLDEGFEAGAAHAFFITYEAGRPGGSSKKAVDHYRRAVELSNGQSAAPHLALAESVAVREQDLARFRKLLDLALAIDPDAVPERRLINTIARRRAERLIARIPDLFLLADLKEEAK